MASSPNLEPIGGTRADLKVSRKKPDTEAYSPDEGQRLIETTLALPQRAWRFRVMALVCSVYGGRANQAIHLTWDDVDMDAEYPVDESTVLQGAITFRKGVLGSKEQDTRTLPLCFPWCGMRLSKRGTTVLHLSGCCGTTGTPHSPQPMRR